MSESRPPDAAPVIDSQDLEHQPNGDTRVNNAGVKVPAPKHEKSLEAVIDDALTRLPPG